MHTHIAVNLPDSLGLAGVILILVAYGLLQLGKLKADSKSFCLSNIMGSALIMYSLYFAWNLSAFIMEGVWILFSVYGLLRLIKKRRTTPL